MNLLLDTHVVLWWLANNPKLSKQAYEAISTNTNTIYVSAASAWEIAIKKALGKLIAPDNFKEAIGESGFKPLMITFDHAAFAGNLPRHHDDPFDRMLIAQAKLENLILVTHDGHTKKYEVDSILA